jgi:hypothetical protein
LQRCLPRHYGTTALLWQLAHIDACQFPGERRRGSRVDQRPPDNHRLPHREHVAAESRFVAAATPVFEDKPILLSVERSGLLDAVATNSFLAPNQGREESSLEPKPPTQLDFLILEVDRAGREICPSASALASFAWFQWFGLLFARSMDQARWVPRSTLIDDREFAHLPRAPDHSSQFCQLDNFSGNR